MIDYAPYIPAQHETIAPLPVATTPLELRGGQRDDARLLITSQDGHNVTHTQMKHIADALRPGDVMVINNSQTIPAHLLATNGRALHLSQQLDRAHWIVEIRTPQGVSTAPFRDAQIGDRYELPAQITATLKAPFDDHRRLWIAHLALPEPMLPYLMRHAQPIRYNYLKDALPIQMYQTDIGEVFGSVEMPSAGRGITPRVLARLKQKGVIVAPITLHCGVSSLERTEPPHAEYFEVPEQTARQINDARHQGHRVIAVGTTALRALESSWRAGQAHAASGHTSLLFSATSTIESVDGLISGFHPPDASHVHVLEAIISQDHLHRAYAEASHAAYLSHEFGDLHLMWR